MYIVAVAYSGHKEALVSLGEWDVPSSFLISCKKFYRLYSIVIYFLITRRLDLPNIKIMCKDFDHAEKNPKQ